MFLLPSTHVTTPYLLLLQNYMYITNVQWNLDIVFFFFNVLVVDFFFVQTIVVLNQLIFFFMSMFLEIRFKRYSNCRRVIVI